MAAPAFCSFLYDSRNPRASMVQPGVSALGKKNKTTLWPRRSFKETSCPFSSGKVNSGALSLIFMGTPVRTRLYRRAGWVVICLVLGLTSTTGLLAQFGKKNTQSKGPRALGLLELYPSGQARLRPICIMIDGRFYDAGIYKADPVPMALDTGIVYEAEQSGESQGLFTIKNVLQNEAKKTFAAEGTWRPAGSEPPKSNAMKVETKPKEEADDKPPVLRRPGAEPSKTDNKETNSKPAETKPSSPNTSTTSQDDDNDRPRLQKPQSTSTSGTQPTAPAQSSTPAASTSTNPKNTDAASAEDENDPNRPHLRRGGKGPTSSSAPIEIPRAATPSPSKPGAKKPSTASAAKNETQLLPAISDSDGPEPRPYTYDITPKEEQAFQIKVLGLASQDLLKQAKELEPGLAASSPATRTSGTGKGTAKAKATVPVWDEVQLKVFDVATSNEPILVLSAKGHLPERTKSATSAVDTVPVEFYVTEVAHSDLYGELRSLFSAVTDDRTLDVTPKYQLIDVVDADGDSRGELLFRRTSDQGLSFVVYRVGADKLWPLYEGTPQ